MKLLILFITLVFGTFASAHSIVELVKQVKPSVVGIGVFDPRGSPRANLQGSGFIVADGNYVITNQHVIDKELDPDRQQKRVVFIGSGNQPKTVDAEVIAVEKRHDLALLKLNEKFVPLDLAQPDFVDDGTDVFFIGFPIGSVLGLYPATHRGIIAASTPVIIPSHNARQLDINTIRRLRDPYFIYQMDATAYPGNSGSAVFNAETGKVVGVINKVFVKTTKESVLSEPSGITYSIPVKYVHELLRKAKIDY